MAGDWVKIEHVTPDKPEIYVMASELGISPEDVFGRCVRIWIWADQQSRDGHAITVTNVTLDAVSRRDGFASALTKCGWLIDNKDGTVSFPNFDRHNGDTAKTRALSNKRQKVKREMDKESNASVTQEVPKVSRSNRDKSVTREEKRREVYIPDDFSISDEVVAYAAKHGYTNLEAHYESFVLTAKAKGYKYRDWDSAFKKAIRENWAKVGGMVGNKPVRPKSEAWKDAL